MGLTPGSYEAYCLDQAVWYVGITITAELEKVGHKPAKGEAAQTAARSRKLAQMLGTSEEEATRGMYADPSAMFK